MSDTDRSFVESVLDARQAREDVTEDYDELVQMFIDLAENRSVPIPFEHVLAYVDPDVRPDTLVFLFVIDTNEDVLADTYGFEVAVKEHVAEQLVEEDADDETPTDIVVQQFSRQMRMAQEAIWDDVVNLGGDEDVDE